MERIRIYRAALALEEFTVSDLAAHSGANANTVRNLVTTRERSNFEVIGHRAPEGRGRPAQRFRLHDRAAVQDMLRAQQRAFSGDPDAGDRATGPLGLPTVDVPELAPTDDLLLTLAWAETQILRAANLETEDALELVKMAQQAAEEVLDAAKGLLEESALNRARLLEAFARLVHSTQQQALTLSSACAPSNARVLRQPLDDEPCAGDLRHGARAVARGTDQRDPLASILLVPSVRRDRRADAKSSIPPEALWARQYATAAREAPRDGFRPVGFGVCAAAIPRIRAPHGRSAQPPDALVRAAQRGDNAAWTELINRFDRSLRAIARSYRLSAADVDDVVQATWTRLFQHINHIHDPNAIAGWLATTTRRECLRQLQVQVREQLTDAPQLGEAPQRHQPETATLAAESRDVLDRAIASLPDRQRQLLTLLASEPDLDYQRISARLAMPVGSIGPARARSLARLGRHLELRRHYIAF